jgi:hypothetical protein
VIGGLTLSTVITLVLLPAGLLGVGALRDRGEEKGLRTED